MPVSSSDEGGEMWGDQAYLRDRQYATPDNLDARARLHRLYQDPALSPWNEWLVEQIDWPDGAILDVGCGPGGLWTEGRPPVRGNVTLCDLSPGMVEAATGALAALGYEVEGLVADAQSIPLDDASRALIVANHMLYHVPDPARAVAEFARILADDGVVMAATNGPDHMAEIVAIEREVFPGRPVDRTATAFGFESGAAYLEAAFDHVELRTRPSPLAVTDPDHVMAYLMSYPPGEGADDEEQGELRRLVGAEFSAGNGVMTITRSSGVFLCRGPRRGS